MMHHIRLVLFVLLSTSVGYASGRSDSEVPMPPGFAVQSIAGWGTVFSDDQGMMLYQFSCDRNLEEDTGVGVIGRGIGCKTILAHIGMSVDSGHPKCVGLCAQSYPPEIAAADAAPIGDWSIISRIDGSKQWAYKGRPVYRYSFDKPGSPSGQQVGGDWALATVAGMVSRRGIAAVESGEVATGKVSFPTAPGVVAESTPTGLLLTNSQGLAVYALDKRNVMGEATSCKDACNANWLPFSAPWAAVSFGDWTVDAASHKTPQWQYKGQPLFTCTLDIKPGDRRCDGAGNGSLRVLMVGASSR